MARITFLTLATDSMEILRERKQDSKKKSSQVGGHQSHQWTSLPNGRNPARADLYRLASARVSLEGGFGLPKAWFVPWFVRWLFGLVIGVIGNMKTYGIDSMRYRFTSNYKPSFCSALKGSQTIGQSGSRGQQQIERDQ